MNSFRSLLRFLRPYKKRVFWALGLATALSFISLIQPLVIKYFVDTAEKGNWERLWLIAVILLSVPICTAVVYFIDNYLLIWVGQRFIYSIRTLLYDRLLRIPLQAHDELGTGRAVNHLMSDVSVLYRFVVMHMATLLNQALWFAIGIAMTFVLSPILALIGVLLLPIYYLNYRIFTPQIRSKYLRIRREMDEVSQRLQENIAGQKLVKVYQREEAEGQYFDYRTHAVMAQATESGALSASYYSIVQALTGFSAAGIYCLGCWLVVEGKMTYGSVLAFMMYFYRITMPVIQITQMSGVFQQVLVSAERVDSLFHKPLSKTELEEGLEPPSLEGYVIFRNVWFDYGDGKPVLRDINLDIRPGTSVALVGKTGCGKTTLTSLILRFHDTTSGEILLDGTDIREFNPVLLRQQIGQVLQDPVLFTGSFRQNISYGRPDAQPEEVIMVAHSAELHDLITQKPLGYDTIIGEKGAKLSVGQRQQVSIARALLKKPAILILDEATASLDPLSESLLQKALLRVLKGRTSFIIAHRLSTITSCDLIVIMDEGRIVEMGTHSELLQKPEGLYKRYFEEQFTALTGS